jgi:light-regulated signal transduction histidine kinase (bacteriophytochrome)
MGESNSNHAPVEIERLRRALEAEKRRSAGLQTQFDQANAEFEEFVSLAAHNLRESLRDIASYSQLLAATYAGRLDSEAAMHLQRIQDGAAKMQSLLADMVDYWAALAVDRQSSRTDMEAVLRQALLCTERQIAERGAVITHDPLPVVKGDFGVLTKVLHHLIRNAIEYCDTPSPIVLISSRREGSEWVLEVRDNGAGIEPAFQARIFQVFKRLHGKEHPGSGLGLAFCKKAIESHGGRMWMESAPGAGSTFYFTLPPVD